MTIHWLPLCAAFLVLAIAIRRAIQESSSPAATHRDGEKARRAPTRRSRANGREGEGAELELGELPEPANDNGRTRRRAP